MSVIFSTAGPPAIPGAQRVTISSTPPKHSKGEFLALLEISLVTLNLRAAVVSLPAIYERISQSFPITSAAQGAMGMLSALSFAVFGTLPPRLTRRFGFEKSLVIAMAMVGVGQ